MCRSISPSLVACVLLLSACGDDPVLLTIEVTTDYLPGIEFTSVETTLTNPTALVERTSARRADDYIDGERVAEFSAPTGRFELTARLLDARGAPIAERHAVVTVRGELGITLVIARSCEATTCPGVGDPDTSVVCAGGRCVEPDCTSATPEACPPAACSADTDCAAASACATPRCTDGICLDEGDDRMCDAGLMCHPVDGCVEIVTPLDGGMDTGVGGMDTGVRDSGPLDADVGPDSAVPCSCANLGDRCTPERDNCFIDGFSCDALTACASPDYTCSSGGLCECNDFVACGVACTTDDDCGESPYGPMSCDPRTNVCREHRRCLDNLSCAADAYCDEGFACRPAGPGMEGETCSVAGDCASGLCETSRCLAYCNDNSDCSAGLECAQSVDATRCVASSGCSGCATYEYCGWTTCRQRCRRTADCTVGDCRLEMGIPGSVARCVGSAAVCDPDEWLVSGRSGNSFCLKDIPCWQHEDCTEGRATNCIWSYPDDETDPFYYSGLARQDGSGFCGHPAI